MNKIKNDIQIDISKIDEPYKSFIKETILVANFLEIKIVLSSERGLDLDDEGTKCNGYFDDEDMVLACACGQDFNKWFSVFIHESSHMDQWVENDPTWIESEKELAGVEVGLILDLWIANHVEANDEQIINFIGPTREVELNCERRTIAKIKKYNLPMDTEYYAQRANSYVHFYNFIGRSRKWYTLGKEPYNIPEIVSRMPKTLDGDYSESPEEVMDLFAKYML